MNMNPEKATDPDGIPGCVHKGSVGQLAGVFVDIFNPSFLSFEGHIYALKGHQ